MSIQIPEISSAGHKIWRNNKGQYHRLDGPAIEDTYGNKYWYQNDRLHRDDGPAVEMKSGDKYWYQNDFRQRFDGPAVEYTDGSKWWYYKDYEISDLTDILSLK